jgi:hypothetical protein
MWILAPGGSTDLAVLLTASNDPATTTSGWSSASPHVGRIRGRPFWMYGWIYWLAQRRLLTTSPSCHGREGVLCAQVSPTWLVYPLRTKGRTGLGRVF